LVELLLLKLKKLRNKIVFLGRRERNLYLIFIIIFSVSLIGIYSGIYRFIFYLKNVPVFGYYLVFKLLSFLLLAGSILIPLSGILVSFNVLFSSEELNFLFTFPLSVRKIFVVKYIETAFYTIWMLFLIFIPIIISYSRLESISFLDGILYTLFILIFFILLATIGVIFSIFLTLIFPTYRLRDYSVAIFSFLFVGFYVFFRSLEPGKFLKPDSFSTTASYLMKLKEVSYLPNYWVSQGLFYLSNKDYFSFFSVLYIMLFLLFLIFVLTVFIGEKSLYRTFLKISGKMKFKKFKKINFKNPVMSLYFRVFKRDSTTISQIILICSLIFLYLFNLAKLPFENYPEVKNLIAFLNIGMIGLILSAISVRFIFPVFSLNMNFFATVFSYPSNRKKVFNSFVKFYLYPVLFIGLMLGYLSGKILNVYKSIFFIEMIVIFISSIIVVNLSFSFGIIYSVKKYENLSQIESSEGGILTMITLFFYFILTLGIIAIPVKYIFLHKFGFNVKIDMWKLSFIIYFLILQILFYFPIRKMALRRFKDFQF